MIKFKSKEELKQYLEDQAQAQDGGGIKDILANLVETYVENPDKAVNMLSKVLAEETRQTIDYYNSLPSEQQEQPIKEQNGKQEMNSNQMSQNKKLSKINNFLNSDMLPHEYAESLRTMFRATKGKTKDEIKDLFKGKKDLFNMFSQIVKCAGDDNLGLSDMAKAVNNYADSIDSSKPKSEDSVSNYTDGTNKGKASVMQRKEEEKLLVSPALAEAVPSANRIMKDVVRSNPNLNRNQQKKEASRLIGAEVMISPPSIDLPSFNSQY